MRRSGRGAGGEETTAAAFAKHCPTTVLVLHDRRIPGTRSNIDHIAVCANGVWVIDSKRYKGKVAIHNPLLGQRALKIGGRDQSKLIAGVQRQVERVTAALADSAPGVPVNGAIAFIGDGLPLIGKLTFDGIPIRYPKQLAKLLSVDGELRPEMVRALAIELARQFPAA